MTEKQWWDLIFQDKASVNDPDLRLGFALWLQDECDDPGAGYLRWCLDTSPVDSWQSAKPGPVRRPRHNTSEWWWWLGSEIKVAENEIPKDVGKYLTGEAWPNDRTKWTIDYSSRRLAEKDALRAWRKARSPSVSENEKQPAGR